MKTYNVYVKGATVQPIQAEECKLQGDLIEFRVEGNAVAAFSRSELIGWIEHSAIRRKTVERA